MLPRILYSLVLPILTRSIQSQQGSLEYCNMEVFNATCREAESEVIMMDSARYGRMSIGRCVKGNYGYLGCAVDALAYLDSKCSGRRHCQFTVPDPVLYDTHPCPGDFTSYLHASFHCVKVENADRQLCHSRKYLKLERESGYIASTMASNYGLGSIHCPWKILAIPGQRINITLYNFARTVNMEGTRGGSNYGPQKTDVCFELAEISDSTVKKTVTLCGGDARVSVVFISSSNEVEIKFINRKILSTVGTFMFHYAVFGCPDVSPLSDAILKRTGDRLKVRCNGSGETWYLTCRDTVWVGEAGNCSAEGAPVVWGLKHIFTHEEVFPYGILVVVAIGVALGIFSGGVLLGLIILYSRGRQSRRQPPGIYDEVKENRAALADQTPMHMPPSGQLPRPPGWYRETRENRDQEAQYSDEGIVRDIRSPIPTAHSRLPDELLRRDSDSESVQLQSNPPTCGRAGSANYNSFSSFRPKLHVYESTHLQ